MNNNLNNNMTQNPNINGQGMIPNQMNPNPMQNTIPNQANAGPQQNIGPYQGVNPGQNMIPNQMNPNPMPNAMPNQMNTVPPQNIGPYQGVNPGQNMMSNQMNPNPMQNTIPNQAGTISGQNIMNNQNNMLPQQQGLNNANTTNESNEDIDALLLECFIGEKYNYFITDTFNVIPLFINIIYLFYRKMLLFGLVISLVFIILQLTPIPDFIIFLGLPIVLSLTTNRLYIYYAKKKVEKIKKKHPESSLEELKEICSKKGGTSIGLCFLGLFIEIIMAFIIMMITLFTVFAAYFASLGINLGDIKYSDQEEIKPYEELLSMDVEGDTKKVFNVNAPTGFKEDRSDLEYEYEFTYEDESCSFILTSSSNSKYTSNEVVKSFAEFNDSKNVSHTDIQTNTINGITWDYIKITDNSDEYYYVTKHNGNIYYLNYSIEKDTTSPCVNLVDQTIQGISIKHN